MTKLIDLTGRQFGRWRVLRRSKKCGAAGQPRWHCLCSCGNKKEVAGVNLRGGKTKSCGCLRDELRPTYAARRDYSGTNNPRAKRNIILHGDKYIASSSVWYKRAAGIFYAARRKGTRLGFQSAVEFAWYVRSVAPQKCPVFNQQFVERGSGFSRWSPSIDRINPRRGYVRGNIQVISLLANCMKRDATPKELAMFAAWVGRKVL